jgi:hypothetical protein
MLQYDLVQIEGAVHEPTFKYRYIADFRCCFLSITSILFCQFFFTHLTFFTG